MTTEYLSCVSHRLLYDLLQSRTCNQTFFLNYSFGSVLSSQCACCCVCGTRNTVCPTDGSTAHIEICPLCRNPTWVEHRFKCILRTFVCITSSWDFLVIPGQFAVKNIKRQHQMALLGRAPFIVAAWRWAAVLPHRILNNAIGKRAGHSVHRADELFFVVFVNGRNTWISKLESYEKRFFFRAAAAAASHAKSRIETDLARRQ